MLDITFTRQNENYCIMSNTTEIEKIIDSTIESLSLNTPLDNFETIVTNELEEKLLSRLVCSYVYEHNKDLLTAESSTGFILVDVHYKDRIVKVSVGLINRENTSKLVNGVLYR